MNNDLLKLAAEKFLEKAGPDAQQKLDLSGVGAALTWLLVDETGKIDLQQVVDKLSGAGLMNMAASWLGNGGNEGIGKDQVEGLFKQEELEGFAGKLGLDKDTAAEGLTGALPQLIDAASKDGQLMTSARGIIGQLFK